MRGEPLWLASADRKGPRRYSTQVNSRPGVYRLAVAGARGTARPYTWNWLMWMYPPVP
jgi:hypothetical protein